MPRHTSDAERTSLRATLVTLDGHLADQPAARALGDAKCIYHVHGKDCTVDQINISVNGCNDNKPYGGIAKRSWTFRTIGYGHGLQVWKDVMSALRLIGYDYVVSIEHEDVLLNSLEGLRGQPRLKPPFPAIKGLFAIGDLREKYARQIVLSAADGCTAALAAAHYVESRKAKASCELPEHLVSAD